MWLCSNETIKIRTGLNLAQRFTESFCKVQPLGFYRVGSFLLCFSHELHSRDGQQHQRPVAPSLGATVLSAHSDSASIRRLDEVELSGPTEAYTLLVLGWACESSLLASFLAIYHSFIHNYCLRPLSPDSSSGEEAAVSPSSMAFFRARNQWHHPEKGISAGHWQHPRFCYDKM